MYEWIDSAAPLQSLLERHASRERIGLDTEFMRIDTFFPKLALVQANLGGEIVLVDPVALGGLGALAPKLASTRTVTVMHSASEDLEALAPSVAGGLGNLFDTQIAAAMTGFGLGLSYQKLVAAVVGVDLPKAETRSDWLQRPLSQQQLEYAAQDVVHLDALHDHLAERLASLGRTQWHAEDCRRLLDRASRRDGDTQPQRSFRGAADWPIERQALLRRVLRWRDDTARRVDRPRPWLLDDARALEFALRPPADSEQLFQRSRGLRALRSEQRSELLQELLRPLAPDELEFAPILPMPAPAQKRALSAMRDVVVGMATQLELPDGLLCARKHLETLVFDRRWPDALDGWRRPLLEDVLMAKLP